MGNTVDGMCKTRAKHLAFVTPRQSTGGASRRRHDRSSVPRLMRLVAVGALAIPIGILGLAGEYADRIVVMHAGHVVESTLVPELFSHPRHPYTAKLITATPKPDMQLADLVAIPGNLADVRRADLPPCRYSARCERHQAKCEAPLPSMSVGPSHLVACWQPL